MSSRTFEGVVHFRSPKAILFQGQYWHASMWLPLSQVSMEPDGEIHWVIHVREWLCEKKNLLEFSEYSEEEIEAMNNG